MMVISRVADTSAEVGDGGDTPRKGWINLVHVCFSERLREPRGRPAGPPALPRDRQRHFRRRAAGGNNDDDNSDNDNDDDDVLQRAARRARRRRPPTGDCPAEVAAKRLSTARRADDRQLREGAGGVFPLHVGRLYRQLVAAGDARRRADRRLPVRADMVHGAERRECVVRGDELHDAPLRRDVGGAVRQLRREPHRHTLRRLLRC
eukprot:gene17306-biopygen7229